MTILLYLFNPSFGAEEAAAMKAGAVEEKDLDAVGEQAAAAAEEQPERHPPHLPSIVYQLSTCRSLSPSTSFFFPSGNVDGVTHCMHFSSAPDQSPMKYLSEMSPAHGPTSRDSRQRAEAIFLGVDFSRFDLARDLTTQATSLRCPNSIKTRPFPKTMS